MFVNCGVSSAFILRRRPTEHACPQIALNDDNTNADGANGDFRDIHVGRVARRKRRMVNHNESYVTAAGAESLFSMTHLWPKSNAATPVGKHAKSYSNIDSVDRNRLPSIDCEWACHSEDEIIQLRQIKFLLDAEMQAVMDRGLHLRYPDVYSDLRLLRFLRKNNPRDVTLSAERYREFLAWREESNVDAIRAMVEKTASSFVPPDGKLRRVAEYFPMKFDYLIVSEEVVSDGSKKVRNGVRPAILFVGSFDTVGISEKIKATESDITLEHFLNYWIYLYESIHFQLYRQSMEHREMMFLDEVCDLSGLSIQQFSPYFVTKVMKPWLRMTQSHYPETTRRIHVLNPPAIVNLAWNLVTPLLSRGTVDKIRFEKQFKGTADEFCQ